MIEQDPGSRRRFASACPGRRASRIDFVDQLEKLLPGEGTKAIRGVLHALAGTPQLQRAFFGGPVIETAPFGVFEHDGQARYEQAIRTKPWEPRDPAAQAPAQSDIRDMAWRPERDGEAQPMPLPDKIRTPEEEARDIVPISDDTRAGTQAPVHDDGMLDPTQWPEHLRVQGQATDDEPQEEVEIESAATATDYAEDDPEALLAAQAQVQEQPARQPVRAEWQTPSRDFRTGIAIAEGGGQRESPWNARHPSSGAMGRYQLTHEALIDAGLKSGRAANAWVPGNPLGIRSDDELRGNRQAQESAFDAVMRRNHVQLERNGAYGTLNQRIEGIRAEFQITQSGLLAAAHRQGAEAVANYMDRMRENRWNSNEAIKGLSEREDKIHRQIETRLRIFSNVR